MMIRNLKALGLALVAIFAMGAMVASTAFAQQGKLTSDGPVTLHTKENTGAGAGPNKLTAFGGNTACPGTVFTGHKYNVTPHTFIPSGETTATISADYGKCTTNDAGGTPFPTTVDMGTVNPTDPPTCDFVFHIGSTTGGVANTYGVTGTVECKNPGEHIRVTLFSDAGHFFRVCTLTVTVPAGGVTGPHLTTDTVNDDINIKGTFGPFTVHKSGLCGAGEDKAATLHIDATITGKNNVGGATGVTITDQ